MSNWDIYLIVDPDESRGQTDSDIVAQVVCAGIDAVELHDERTPTARLIAVGRIVREITRSARATLIVHRRLDVATAVEADGARVTADEVPAARAALGPRRLVLATVASTDEARRAQREGADYIVVGPVFARPNEPASVRLVALPTVAAVKRAVTIPVIAFGGISADNVGEVIAAGVDAVGVSEAITDSPDIPLAAKTLRLAIQAQRRASGLRPN